MRVATNTIKAAAKSTHGDKNSPVKTQGTHTHTHALAPNLTHSRASHFFHVFCLFLTYSVAGGGGRK